jgi:hypothetical protein
MIGALRTGYKYVLSEEGAVGAMTVAVLIAACAAMVIDMMSNPELIEVLALAG